MEVPLFLVFSIKIIVGENKMGKLGEDLSFWRFSNEYFNRIMLMRKAI